MIRRRELALLRRVAVSRPPDFIIGSEENPYLRRWWLIPRNGVFNVYLHEFLRSDDDRALHDHPYVSASIILDGRYWEVLPVDTRRPAGATRHVWRAPGRIAVRGARAAHRVALSGGRPAWTLFITGPRVREWGFHCPAGWRHWQEFTARGDKGRIGRGCE